MLDETDIKILEILQNNGRTRRNDLAEKVGLSIPSTSDRLRKLEERDYILGYAAILNAKLLGKDITAFIMVKIDSSKHYQTFIDHAKANDEILECHAITGEGSHLLKIMTENTTGLERLLAKIQSWTGVTGTRTNLVLSTSKETTKIKMSNLKQ
ncbi:MAG: Lrp/AsnC family transcriptional regulator [Ignavibacteriales bacterium]|nr:Lrp/AsnC family transcriptional regulator [Ignavibacteriales bacterium]